MRIIRIGVLGLLVATSAAAAEKPAISLTVTALDPAVKAGAKIMVRVITANESNHEVKYNDTSRSCDFRVSVLTSAAVSAPETAYKKQLNCDGGGLMITRNILVTLKPGETNEEFIEITELYDMSKPGKYSVKVDRTFPGIGHFRSNPVSVAVAP